MALATTRLSPTALCVTYGYGQVEPNHLSARRNGQIYAQLPADPSITLLENGMFAKYDYKDGLVKIDTAGNLPGEWLLVFNEVKVYEDYQTDADFAMHKDNYQALVYNAMGDAGYYHYNVQNQSGTDDDLEEVAPNGGMMPYTTDGSGNIVRATMVPRLLRTQPGDIYTTNCITEAYANLAVGNVLKINKATGYLSKSGDVTDQEWVIVKKYNMPDLQPGVKIQRVK